MLSLSLRHLGDISWVKARHQWGSAQARLCTYAVDAAADALIMYARSGVQPVAMGKQLL